MIQAVIINGKPRTGKDTFVDLCVEELLSLGVKASKASSVDEVKIAAAILGWDGEKDNTGRKFLSDLKDLSTAAYDGPLQYMLQVLDDQGTGVVFFMIREPEEIAEFIAAVPGTLTFQVIRPTDEPEFDNHADQRVGEYDYDFTIMNDGNLTQLIYIAEGCAKEFAEAQSN